VPMADAPAHHAPAPHAQARTDRIERAAIRAINRQRARYGLPALHLSSRLGAIATWHSWDMLRHGMLSHSSSDGTPFYTRIRRVVPARTVGETLIEYRGRYGGYSIVRAWLHSPPHRAELLSRSYHRIGVGRWRYRGMSVVTADFTS
jgi:uncharacterized protein YkwD